MRKRQIHQPAQNLDVAKMLIVTEFVPYFELLIVRKCQASLLTMSSPFNQVQIPP